MAAFGGLTVLDIEKDGTVHVRRAKISDDCLDELNRNLVMFYTTRHEAPMPFFLNRAQELKRKKRMLSKACTILKI